MNNHNIKYWETEKRLYAEWADRAPDDEDRYEDDGIVIKVYVPKEQGHGALKAKLYNTYDQWIQDTRY